MTNKEIATEVILSDKTVKNYVSSILSKLDLERRAQAAAYMANHRVGVGAQIGGQVRRCPREGRGTPLRQTRWVVG